MDFTQLGVLVAAFFTDPRTLGAFALIGVDLVTGIWSAIHRKMFEWGKLGDILEKTAVFVFGYLCIYLLSLGGVDKVLTPYITVEGAAIVAQTIATGAAGFSYLKLLADIGEHWTEIRGPAEPTLAVKRHVKS